MVAIRKALHVFLLLAILFFPLLRADLVETVSSEISHKTFITLKMSPGEDVTVKLTYFNLSYYSKLNIKTVGANPAELEPDSETTQEARKVGVMPMNNSSLYFLFEGTEVSQDGINTGCYPVRTNAKGEASCRIAYFKNSSGQFETIENKKSCGTLSIEFRGEWRGSDEYRPSSKLWVACPSKSGALTAFGPALFTAFTSSNNLPYCFPALIILGLLIASMYYSGRDPLSLFDITTPRLPRAKPARVSGGSTAMSIRTAVAKYREAQRRAVKLTGNFLDDVGKNSGKGWVQRRQAKKDLRRFFNRLQEDLDSMRRKNQFDDSVVRHHEAALRDLFVRHGLKDVKKEQRKFLSKYVELSGALMNLYTFSEHGMRSMQAARAPSGGLLYKKISDAQQWLTDRLISAEEKFQWVPGYKKLGPFIPGFSILAAPHKLVDVIAQRRSAKGWVKYTTRQAYGQLFYQLGTRRDKATGERTDGLLMRALKKVAGNKAAGIGKFANWYFKWDYDKFKDKHNVMMKQAINYRDEVSKYQFVIAEQLNTALFMVHDLVNFEIDQSTLDHIQKKLAEKRDKERLKTFDDIRQEIHQAQKEGSLEKFREAFVRLEGANGFGCLRSGEAEKLKSYIALLGGFIEAKKHELIGSKIGAILRAKGIDTHAEDLKSHLDRLNEIQGEAQKFGLVKLDKNKGAYEGFQFTHLKSMLQISEDEVLQSVGVRVKRAKERADEVEIHRAQIAEKLNAKIKELFGDSAIGRLAESEGKYFFLNMARNAKPDGKTEEGSGERLFRQKVMGLVADALIPHMDKGIDRNATDMRREIKSGLSADGKVVGNKDDSEYAGVAREFQNRLAAINARLSGDTDNINFGSDPAGIFIVRTLKQLSGILGNPNGLEDLRSIHDIMDFEVLFYRAANRKNLVRAFSDAIENASEEQKVQICRAISIDGSDSDVAAIRKQLNKVVDNRQMLRERIDRMNESDFALLCDKVGLRYTAATSPSSHREERIARPDTEQILERLHLLEARGSWHDRREVKKALSALGLGKAEQEKLQHSSVVEYIFTRTLEKTQNSLDKWGAQMLRTGLILNGSVGDWLTPASKLRKDFRDEALAQQAIEYAAMRKSLSFTQYQGESGQHIETLLYMCRRYNRAAEYAIAKSINAYGEKGYFVNVTGNMLGSLNSILQNNLQSYAAQKTMYENLINKNSKFYDENFVRAVLGKGKDAQVSAEEVRTLSTKYDAAGYYALQERGIRFRDARLGLGYIVSSANEGAIPLLEYNPNMVRIGNRKGGSTTISRDEEREYGILLSRLNVSEFASEIKGLVAVKNVSRDSEPENWRRINPANIQEVQTLFETAKSHPYTRNELSQRTNLALIMAGAGTGGIDGKPMMRFISGSDYVRHLPLLGMKLGQSRAYHEMMSRAGEFAYGVFYQNVPNLRTWYAAQARARHAIYTIAKMTGEVVDGKQRLNATGYLGYNDLVVKDAIDRWTLEKKDEREGATLKAALREMVQKLHETDKSADWVARNYRRTTKEAADAQSGFYAAQLELKALQKMKVEGMLRGVDDTTYSLWVSELRQQVDSRRETYKRAQAGGETYRNAVIELTGSHGGGGSNTYYGSSRNIFTMSGLIPAFDYKTGMKLEFGMAIESSAMRDSAINRGGQKGARYWEEMNMNTGQGAYENPRWWATSMYEQQMAPYLMFSHFVHRAFLPLASTFYRMQAGLSSFLQRTELETEFGKQRGRLLSSPLYFLGLKGGMNDIISSTAQELADFWGASTAMASLRRGGNIRVANDGTLTVAPTWYAQSLSKMGFESDWVWGESQLRWQARIQDRVKTSKEWADNVQVRAPDGSSIGIQDAVREWSKTYEEYLYASASDEKERLDQHLKYYEKILDPFATKYVDERQESNKRSIGGNYFIKDGSRDRFMEIFMRDHMSTWAPVIPGMHEYGPWQSSSLSPQMVNYYERAKDSERLGTTKEFRYYSVVEKDNEIDFVLRNAFNTHRDAMREVYRLETPALMQHLKIQADTMHYESFTPLVSGFISSVSHVVPFLRLEQRYQDKQQEKLKLGEDYHRFAGKELSQYGFASQYAGADEMFLYQHAISDLRENIAVKRQNWDEVAAGKEGGKTTWRRLSDVLLFKGESAVERLRFIGLQSGEEQRNLYEVRRQILLQTL